MTYRLLNYSIQEGGEPQAGILLGDQVFPLDALSINGGGPGAGSTLALIQDWVTWQPRLEAFAESGGEGESSSLDSVILHAPLLYPGALFFTAGNYHDHIKEMDHGYEVDKSKVRPYFFLKAPPDRAVTGQDKPVRMTSHCKLLDWEAELAVVIGRTASNISKEEAMDHVAGYTIVNDLSARDHLFREDWPQFKTDWFGQKCFDQSVPMGPWITPASEVPDTGNLGIRLWVNGDNKQDTGTQYMIFNIPEQIEALSRQVTLKPGDVISTGTGSGVGGALGSDEKEYLKSGDLVRIEIDSLGTLEHAIA